MNMRYKFQKIHAYFEWHSKAHRKIRDYLTFATWCMCCLCFYVYELDNSLHMKILEAGAFLIFTKFQI